MLTALVTFLLVLGVLVFFHELGHFCVARLCGVTVQTFSLGFGPKIWTRKSGDTEYCISIVPLGGYVRMLGDDPAESIPDEDAGRSFLTQSLWKKIAIVVAGPFFNFILAFFIFTGVFMAGVPTLAPIAGEIEPGSAAALGGMKKGDRILSLNGQAVTQWDEIPKMLQENGAALLRVVVLRSGREITLNITPIQKERQDIFGEGQSVWVIGIASTGEYTIKKHNPFSAVYLGVGRTVQMTWLNLVGIFKLIEGKISRDNIGGPILIAQMAAKQAEEGFLNVLLFTAFISINLGVINLFPVPILDGGHLLFFLIEAVIGRPISAMARERAQQVGLFLLVSLMVFAFYNDIMRLDIMKFFVTPAAP